MRMKNKKKVHVKGSFISVKASSRVPDWDFSTLLLLLSERIRIFRANASDTNKVWPYTIELEIEKASEILLCVTKFDYRWAIEIRNGLPCILLSWSGEQLLISSLQLCQLSLGSAEPGTKMFWIWIKAISWGLE